MAWQSEMVRIIRHIINDMDSSNYSFTDDRLEEVRSNALNSISLRDGPYAIDLRGITTSLAALHKLTCDKYDEAVMQYRAGGSIGGKAIIAPFSNNSRGSSSYYGSGRDGYFGG